MDILKNIFEVLKALITDNVTGYEELDYLLYTTLPTVLSVISVVVLLLLILFNPDIRKRRRTEDRIMFNVFIVLVGLHLLRLSYQAYQYLSSEIDIGLFIFPGFIELFYAFTILIWLVFVDYCMFRSLEHIKRKFRFAWIIPLIILVSEICTNYIAFGVVFKYDDIESIFTAVKVVNILYISKCIIYMCFILTASHVVIKRSEESREPRFLRLGVFIIPFLLGTLFRAYDASFVTLGIVLTYAVVKKRDRYIDNETGFYNRDYLDYLSVFRDKKKYLGGDGVIIAAPGNGEDMIEILKEFRPANSDIFILAEDRFLLLSETVRDVAVDTMKQTITEAAGMAQEPYTPLYDAVSRAEDETAESFVSRILNSDILSDIAPKGEVL